CPRAELCPLADGRLAKQCRNRAGNESLAGDMAGTTNCADGATTLSHTSEGHRVSVHYGYDDKGRLTGERQTVENPETGELLWHHETGHAYNEQGLANRVTPDSLPPVEWLTYGSGYLAGMKLGGTPLLEFTRDRLHRETVRSFGSMAGSNAAYKLTSTYTPAGQLQSQHLNSLVYDRDYGW
ncbi:TPA: hypothetical protein ACH7E1_004822, partial [Escherichia coli]